MQIIVCKLVVLLFGQNNKAPKPKQCLSATGTNKMLQHAGRIMKLTAVLLLGVCMQIYAAGYGQRITLSERDVPIEKVLKKIQQQTTYKFLYTSQLLQRVPKVTVVVKDATVEDVLELVLKGQMLDYEVSEGTVVIRAKKEAPVKETTQANMPDPIEIRGVITDENGAPASGVNVMVKGTSKGTTTNLRGEFVLRDVSENAVLLITSVGYDRQEILVKGKEMINTQLKIAVGNLDEMQVIAYGKTSKRLNTGNVTSVKAKDIEMQPINNPLLALQGRVPGLFITQSNGLPGSAVTVRIQGQNSIRSGNDPLYVIDGVPYTSQLLPSIGSVLGLGRLASDGTSYYGNPLSFLNPADIQSIEILKDADATAIYGSRAANGAILITTKKGETDKQTRVTINFQAGGGMVTRKLDLLETQQYLEMRHEAKANDGAPIGPTDYDVNGTWDTTRNTDWQKELIGKTSRYSNLQATVSGGNSITQFLLGAGYKKETTVFPGDLSDQKGSIHFNINNVSNNQKFHLQFSGNYMVDHNRLIETDLTGLAIRLAPDAPALYNDDGTVNWEIDQSGNSTFPDNPLALLNNKYNNKTYNLISNANLSYEIIHELRIRASFGYTYLQSNETKIYPLLSTVPQNRPFISRFSLYGNNNISSWIVEPQVTYNKRIGRGKLDVLIGTTIQNNNSKGQILLGSGYNNDLSMEDIKSASTITAQSSVASTYKYNALFGKVNYNWKDKYVLNLSARRDGSSRFGIQNQFHNFGSVGLGWIFSQERFISSNLSFLSFGKFRGSYGTSGNDQIGDYQYLSQYASTSVDIPYQGAVGLLPTGLANPYLQWEKTKKLQFGIDLGLFKDRILLTTNYNKNRTSNELLPYSLPWIAGFNSISRNFPATVENTGWEFSLVTKNINNKHVSWTSNLNLTVPKNKLVGFADLATSSYVNALVIGEPITINKVFHFLGVDPASGTYQFADSKGEPVSIPDNLNDRTVLINTAPTLYGGIQNTFTYKSFQFDLFFQFVKQNGQNYLYGHFAGGRPNVNQPTTILNRWQKPGDIKPVQKYNSNFALIRQALAVRDSDVSLTDASYARLKNLSLSWQLPQKWQKAAHLHLCKFYIQAQNLITITNYSGLDPETLSSTSLPPLKVLTLGIQVGL